MCLYFFQIFNLLWSDPQPSDGCYPNTLRGAGTYFGPDVTKQFLEKHNLMFIVRSHECKIDGYEEIHNRKVSFYFYFSNTYTVLDKKKHDSDHCIQFANNANCILSSFPRNIYK